MKLENNVRTQRRQIHWMLLVLIAFCLAHCKEDDVKQEQEVGYDPSKPVLVTDFSPKEGGSGTDLVIYGENFGSDLSKIKVTVGGQIAKVVKVSSNSLYCIVPMKAYDGDIKVSVLDDNKAELAQAAAKERLTYIKKFLVSTFLGTKYEVETDYKEKEGPFDDCGAFKGILWLTFDPLNHNRLYFSGDKNNARLIDFENKYVSIFKTNMTQVSMINWRLDGNRDMIVTDNQGSDTKYGNYIFSRSSNFLQRDPIPVYARSVNGTMIHPQNGELYYSKYYTAEVRRYDFNTKEDKLAFTTPDSRVSFYMVVHPSGDYAYLIANQKHYIMRTDYDREKKIFKIPYTVCGASGTAGYADGVGTAARLSNPVQGVFVKNPDYEKSGEDDLYDFYFCDATNHAIRILTPQSRVSTFAGRGNNGTSGYANGDLRLQARFNTPQAIVYDEERSCFYIGDTGNWVIRKIAKED
ncbi:IPT/TIG domain-containing protein [Pararcticibacter amylolyticus]|uniref:IPT/TIG domain-containing protein n=1 Tax=Pararcticibacter amylolyticus TaxID=2173175 RepID=A0A2U2PDT8_9SPHI|nr:IPT/TIG domain-containing protein [Pararcticibacter amylolyticus]PWG79520.1 hypothetical protein DDR33_17035 [Pararcticibacter amylolyticus]